MTILNNKKFIELFNRVADNGGSWKISMMENYIILDYDSKQYSLSKSQAVALFDILPINYRKEIK